MDTLNYTRDRAVPLNIEDLNRIEEWTEYLRSFLESYGYYPITHTRRWTQKDIPWQTEIDRIRKNIKKLYDAYVYLPTWKEITYSNSLDYEQVNVMEWDLQTIYDWLCRMVSIFWYSNEFHTGEGGIA